MTFTTKLIGAPERLILFPGLAIEVLVGLYRFVILPSVKHPGSPSVVDVGGGRCRALRPNEERIETEELIKIAISGQEVAWNLGPERLRNLVEVGHLMSQMSATTLMSATHLALRVRARDRRSPVTRDRQAPREEWLIVEWPDGHDTPSDYWMSNLPAGAEPERLARLARLRWMIELDYKQLKGELGLDHYEGRSYLGFHHHCALVTAAHGFLTLERQNPNRPPPA